MNIRSFLVLLLLFQVGCTSIQLQRNTLSQTMSLVDLRNQEVINAFADVASNPGALPSLSLNGTGQTTVTNSVSIDAITGWGFTKPGPFGVVTQGLSLTGKHEPAPQWNLEPVADNLQLTAVHGAMHLMLYHSFPRHGNAQSLLDKPKVTEVYNTVWKDPQDGWKVFIDQPKPHFNVLDRLLPLMAVNWLGSGSRREMPRDVCYCANRCGTYVWVTPECMPYFSEFTLILLDIATTSPDAVVAAPAMAIVEMVNGNSSKLTIKKGILRSIKSQDHLYTLNADDTFTLDERMNMLDESMKPVDVSDESLDESWVEDHNSLNQYETMTALQSKVKQPMSENLVDTAEERAKSTPFSTPYRSYALPAVPGFRRSR